MARIHSPNKQYDGVSASVRFDKGVGETSNPHLIKWFKEHGYEVIEGKPTKGVSKADKKAEEPSEVEVEE